jgi:hypothetical protein
VEQALTRILSDPPPPGSDLKALLPIAHAPADFAKEFEDEAREAKQAEAEGQSAMGFAQQVQAAVAAASASGEGC